LQDSIGSKRLKKRSNAQAHYQIQVFNTSFISYYEFHCLCLGYFIFDFVYIPLFWTENVIPMEPCITQNHNIDIDLFKRKANRVPLSPLTQGIHFLNQLHDMHMLYCYMKISDRFLFLFKIRFVFDFKQKWQYLYQHTLKKTQKARCQIFFSCTNCS
jgi:hypothetical protein